MKNQINPNELNPSKPKQQLFERVFEEWREIPAFFIKQLYASFPKIPKQLSNIVTARGHSTKY